MCLRGLARFSLGRHEIARHCCSSSPNALGRRSCECRDAASCGHKMHHHAVKNPNRMRAMVARRFANYE